MEFDHTFALHITWTCYGTWLPGDRRGYVSNTIDPVVGYEPKQNAPGTPYRADAAYTYHRAQKLQKGATVSLSPAQALCAAESLIEAARVRDWRILRGAVMSNHIHVVVT